MLLANHGAPTGGWCTAGRSGAWGPVGRGPHLDAAGSAPGAGVLVVPVGHDAVWHFLSTKAYWGGWLSRSDVDAQVTGAWRVVSAHTDGAVVGFARAVSDGVAVAYLADVFVAESVRGCGVAKAMLALMIDAGPGADFRWMLHTMDAHGLYRQLGFTEPTDRYLERSPRRS